MADVEARAPVPPLLAYTASKQKERSDRKGKVKVVSRIKPGVSKVYKNNTYAIARPRARKGEKKIDFDESARREYLTGFHKRKQARIEKGKDRAKEREKLERKQLRVETREARKKQAAENVAAEKVAYGDGQDDDSTDESDEQEDDEADRVPPSAFETEQHHTTITVQEWDPNEPEESNVKEVTKRKIVKESLPPSSRRMAKKLKNSKVLSGAKEISKLIDSDDELPTVYEEQVGVNGGRRSANNGGGLMDNGDSMAAKKIRKPKFHYESKLDRAKAKSQARETKAKWAEKRREERSAGGGKGRMQKNKGKRGHGNKGSSKKK